MEQQVCEKFTSFDADIYEKIKSVSFFLLYVVVFL